MQERRFAVRYPFYRAVYVGGADGKRFPAETTEISLAGVGLLLDREAVVALASGGSILTLGDAVKVLLPPAEGEGFAGELDYPGRVQHDRRLSQDRYHVGIGFDHLEGEREDRLRKLVEAARAGMPL